MEKKEKKNDASRKQHITPDMDVAHNEIYIMDGNKVRHLKIKSPELHSNDLFVVVARKSKEPLSPKKTESNKSNFENVPHIRLEGNKVILYPKSKRNKMRSYRKSYWNKFITNSLQSASDVPKEGAGRPILPRPPEPKKDGDKK